jgi:hypothetical protein
MILKEPETKILPASANNRRPRPGGYSDEHRQNSPASRITRNHTTRAQEKTHMEERTGDRWEEEEERRREKKSAHSHKPAGAQAHQVRRQVRGGEEDREERAERQKTACLLPLLKQELLSRALTGQLL